MFFSFDGIDGVGKSTQIELFVDWLNERGYQVCNCRDPGSTPLGDRVREILLHSGDDTPIGPTTEMLLYMACRAQLVQQVIQPALAAGKVVVSDRYLLANVVYQGHAGGLAPEAIKQVGAVATGGLTPDCTFLLDLDSAEADNRLTGPRDRLERRGAEYRERLRQGFLAEAAAAPAAISVLDASQSIQALHQQVRAVALEHLPRTTG